MIRLRTGITFKGCFNELTLKSILSRERGGFPPQNIFSKTYTFYLTNPCGNYLLDGRCSLSNNAAENAIRPFVTGRKNWLFADTPKGAAASAAVYSLIETAKANGLDVYLYLQNLLANMTDWDHTDEYLEDFLPWSKFIQETCTR